MKKRNWIILSVIMVILMLVLAGCGGGGPVEDDMAKDLGEGLAEGLTGADVEFEGTWPEQMPGKVPQFKQGNIINSSALTVGGQKSISVILEDVKEKDFIDYISEVKTAGFTEFLTSESGGIIANTYQEGENALSLQYVSKTGEMTISYTGQ